MQKEKSQESFEQMLLRLGSTASPYTPTTTCAADDESPVSFTDSCSKCGSKKRRCIAPSFEPRKKMILVDPTSLKDVFPIARTSYDSGPTTSSPSLSRQNSFFSAKSSPFDHSISELIPSPATPSPFKSSVPMPSSMGSLRRCISAPITSPVSFVQSGSFSSPKSPEKVAVTPTPVPSPPLAPYFNRFGPFGSFYGSSDTQKTRTPENAPAISTLPSNPPSIGKSGSDPISYAIPTAPEKDDETAKTKTDQSFPAATKSMDQESQETIKKVQFSCSCGKRHEVSFFD